MCRPVQQGGRLHIRAHFVNGRQLNFLFFGFLTKWQQTEVPNKEWCITKTSQQLSMQTVISVFTIQTYHSFLLQDYINGRYIFHYKPLPWPHPTYLKLTLLPWPGWCAFLARSSSLAAWFRVGQCRQTGYSGSADRAKFVSRNILHIKAMKPRQELIVRLTQFMSNALSWAKIIAICTPNVSEINRQ